MEQSTCAVHECATTPTEDGMWCAEHAPTNPNTKKVCPGCGVAINRQAKHCIWCSRNVRFFGTTKPDLPKCKTCGETITGRNRAKGVYCSRKCVYADPAVRAKLGPARNQVVKNCPWCKKDFSVPASTAHRYNYCTRVCSLDALGTTSQCKRCGKEFRHPKAIKRSHCSEECYRPPHYVECVECGKTFRDTPSQAATRRFCGNSCYRRHTGETSIEAAVREVIESTGMIYSQEAPIGGWVVDFAVLPNIIIEADGDYWHTLRPDVDARKTEELEALGYLVIRITETDIRSGAFRKPLLKALRTGVHENRSPAAA